MNTRTIGVRGATWRGEVTGHGSLLPSDGSREMDWFIAADDRWYVPRDEASTRQRWYAGFPVCETRVRIPGGDMIQRLYATADLGGLTVMEFENDSPMPVVVAVTRSDVFTTREPHHNPPRGIDLPEGSLLLPVGHRSSTRVALSHVDPAPGRLPDDVATHQQLVRGWEGACDAASRLTLPDHTVVATVARVRSDLMLGIGRTDATVIEEVRLGEHHRDSIVEVAEVVQRRLRVEKRAKRLKWDTPHLMSTAAAAAVMLGDDTAAGDIAHAWLRMADTPVEPVPATMPEGIGSVAWAESLVAFGSPSGGECRVFPHGIPETWWGAPFDVRGVVADPHRRIGLAVRWHGPRPALLWEVTGQVGLVVSHRGWHSVDATGETLLEAPEGAPIEADSAP